jgi:hypothetical protein
MRTCLLAILMLFAVTTLPAHAQGIPERVQALERGLAAANANIATLTANLAVATTRIGSLETARTAQNERIEELLREIRAVDEGKGLVRAFLEQYSIERGVVTPPLRQFTDRGPIAALVFPIGNGVPGNPPFVVANGATSVRYADCLTFSMHGRLIIEGSGSGCPGAIFDVLYLFSGPPFPRR